MLVRQIFPDFITFLTVLRHPIERVLSSYRMKVALYADQAMYWNMKAWLSGTPVRISKNATSTNMNHLNQNKLRADYLYLKTSSLEEVTDMTSLGFSFICVHQFLSKYWIHWQNYMVKWFSGKWNPTSTFRATRSDLDRAKRNIDKFDYVVFTDRLHLELPVIAALFNYTKAPKSVCADVLMLSFVVHEVYSGVCILLNLWMRTLLMVGDGRGLMPETWRCSTVVCQRTFLEPPT